MPSGLRTEVRGCEIKQPSRSTGIREINHKENDLGGCVLGLVSFLVVMVVMVVGN